ncbi:MAG: hypothetical protein KGI67_02930 [Pseudomonadota bacterium]|nr:hypothetical protein [Pseudomonadota bacterium]
MLTVSILLGASLAAPATPALNQASPAPAVQMAATQTVTHPTVRIALPPNWSPAPR